MSTIYGTSNKDTITPTFVSPGVTGVPSRFPGPGMDTIYARAGNDTVDGGAGNDTIYLGAGNDYVNITSTGNDIFYGEDGNDYIYGYTGNETYYGGAGNDTLLGHGGNDTVDGGAGSDSMNGGAGTDFMDGGPGSDVYEFSNIGDMGLGNARDIIVYDDATDRVDLSEIITPAFTFIGATTLFTGVNQVGVRTEGTNTIIALNTTYTPVSGVPPLFDPYPEAEIIAQDGAYTVADYEASDFIL